MAPAQSRCQEVLVRKSLLCSNVFEHGEIDEQVAALAQSGRHGFIEGRNFDTHPVIGAIIEHWHKVTVTTDEHDTVNGSPFDEAHDIHTQVEVQVGLFCSTGKGLVILRSNAIAKTLHGLQEHLLLT